MAREIHHNLGGTLHFYFANELVRSLSSGTSNQLMTKITQSQYILQQKKRDNS